MNMYTSGTPKPCLSKNDAEYLRRNAQWADKHPLWSDIIFFFVFLGLLILSISQLITITQFDIFIHYSDVAFFVLSLIFFIYVCLHLDVKRKVSAIRKKISKC